MLSKKEQLKLQQLSLLDAVAQRKETVDASADDYSDGASGKVAASAAPASWSLTGEAQLHAWQKEALEAWFAAGGRGTIKVVTGAGKTMLALAIVDQLQQRDPELRVAVVVPTIVLMQQWYQTILTQSHLGPASIGRLGGGYKDDLRGDRRILLAVLASARKELPSLARNAALHDKLLLVVDESHRAGAPEMSQVLKTPRAYTLGLSATPERGEGLDAEEESDMLKREIGGIVFEMTYADAISQGILPPFEVHHFGLPLNPNEARRYAALTRSINDTRRELSAASPAARKAQGSQGLLRWARRVASRTGALAPIAARYVNDTSRRKQLLYGAKSRAEAALSLVRSALAEDVNARVILFHESISEVEDLFRRMVRAGVPAVMEHSELSQELRDRSLNLFREGTGRAIVSARSLIEGFDVPEADLGIVVASSTSSRQRIQSIGRVLRKHRTARGEEKSSRICVLYIRDTVDETIYEKEDWDRLIGLDRNLYFSWDPPNPPVEQAGSPREAIPGEDEVDLSQIKVGDVYPGRYQGAEYSVDARGNVLDADRLVALNPQDIPEAVIALRGQPGRFRVTPRRNAVLVRVPERNDEWVTRFAGVLASPFAFAETVEDTHSDQKLDVLALEPGDEYGGPLAPTEEFRFRQRGGGTITRKVRGGELSARGPDAERVVDVLQRLSRRDAPVSRFYVNDLRHAFWREEGKARFIAALGRDLEFPERST
jgi:superfamily II DNA or RNA helicase